MQPAETLALATLGVTGSVHCLGMCGAFPLTVDYGVTGLRRLAPQLLYHLGKTTAYLFLGAWAGWAGFMLHRMLPGQIASTILAVAAALLMGSIALQILGVLRLPVLDGLASVFGNLLAPLLTLRPASRGLLVGVVNGFLPCPLVYAFVAKAAHQARLVDSLTTMAILGLSTIPALVATAVVGRPITGALRARAYRLLGVLLLLFAVYTGWRGVAPWLGMEHHHHGMDHASVGTHDAPQPYEQGRHAPVPTNHGG
jgi:sulfite exporter TauE/SafE